MTINSTLAPLAIDPSVVIKTGATLWEKRELLKKPWQNVRRHIKRNSVCVVVFGPGGVGKTTLGKFLAEDFDPSAKPEAYQESMDKETFWLRCDPSKKIIVAPGQEHRIDRYKAELLEQMTRAKTAVLCNVVSYGFHALSREQKIKPGSTVQEYLIEQRQRELEITTELADFLSQTTMPLKMVTLLTKQDLWWKSQEDVKNHYENGDYAAQIARIQSAKGSQHFVHEYVYTSLFLHNLKDSSGQTIGLTTEGYDDTLRFDSQRKAFDVIEKFTR